MNEPVILIVSGDEAEVRHLAGSLQASRSVTFRTRCVPSVGIARLELAKGGVSAMVVAVGNGDPATLFGGLSMEYPHVPVILFMDEPDPDTEERLVASGSLHWIIRGSSSGVHIRGTVHRALMGGHNALTETESAPAGWNPLPSRLTESLKDNLSLMEAILESVDSGILVVGTDGAVRRTNSRFARMWRIPPELMAAGNDALLLDFVRDQLIDPDGFLNAVIGIYGDQMAITRDRLAFKDGRIFERTSRPMLVDGGTAGRVWCFHDVTDRIRSEEELRDSREHLAATLRSIGDGVIGTDRDGRITELNPVAEELMGWTLDEARGMMVEDAFRIMNTDTKATVENPVRSAMAEKRIIGLANHTDLVAKDGTVRHIADSCAPILDNAGNVTGAVLVFRDVTENYRLHREMGRSNGMMKSLLDSLPIGIYMVDASDGHPLVANEAALEMLGPGLLSGTSADGLGEVYQAYKASSNEPYPVEGMPLILGMRGVSSTVNDMMVRRPDGSEARLEVTGTPVTDGEGRVWASLVNFADITERMRAEEQARLQQERLSLALEASGDGIWDLDLRTYMGTVNPRFFEMLGYPVPEDLGIHMNGFLDMVHPDDRQRLLTTMEELERTRVASHQIEIRLIAADGSTRWILIRYRVVEVSPDGFPVRALGVNTDTTERKLREEELGFLSSRDKLTGLFNRRHAEGCLKEGILGGVLPTALIMGDVNGLKLINDTFGHAEGDRLLLDFADILKDVIGERGIVARWGGDEFLIILPGMDDPEANALMNRIKEACRTAHHEQFPLSVALGHAARVTAEQTVEEVMREAEERMYHGKLMEGKSARSAIISALRETLSSKTNETDEHCQRMQDMALHVADAMGLPDNVRDDVALLALLHDIGKIGVPENILVKPGRLTPEEMAVIRKHSEIGYRIAKASYEITHIAEGILSHHEWWDGTGYPQGLKGAEIPMTSRIVSIIDAFDAMVSDRPYRKTLTTAEAVLELERCAGSQFDPDIVGVVTAMFPSGGNV